jgi:tellurite resistance protein
MGLFDGLRGKNTASLDLATAVMVPAVAAMLSDGSIEDEEVSQIRAICLLSPLFRENSRDEDTDLILKAIKLVESHGAEDMCMRAAATLSPALRETAFAFATAMVMSDGHVGRKEEAVVDNLVQWLSLSQDRASAILSVIAVLQHAEEAQQHG